MLILSHRKRCGHPIIWMNVLALFYWALCAPHALAQSHSKQTRSQSGTAGRAEQLIFEGFTQPRHEIMVAATEIGRLDSLTVDVGAHVQAGQLIGRLENALQASSVRIATLQAEMTGEIEAAKAEVALHQLRVESLRELTADGMARPDELVRAETDLRIASARLLTAQEQKRLRQTELERYQLQLERREIRAPMSGVIAELFHKPGEYIAPSDPAVVRLLVMDTIEAVFNVPVEDVRVFQVGTPVHIFLRSQGRTVRSTVSSISPDIDGESGTVQVRVLMENRDGQFLAGDRCTMRLARPTSDSQTAYGPRNTVPSAAVRPNEHSEIRRPSRR